MGSMLLDRRALRPVLLDLREITLVTDYFLVATATSEVHLHALADALLEQMREHRVRPVGVEGRPGSGWLLLDFGEVVVHLFGAQERAFYDLERLWGDAPRTELEPEPTAPAAGS